MSRMFTQKEVAAAKYEEDMCNRELKKLSKLEKAKKFVTTVWHDCCGLSAVTRDIRPYFKRREVMIDESDINFGAVMPLSEFSKPQDIQKRRKERYVILNTIKKEMSNQYNISDLQSNYDRTLGAYNNHSEFKRKNGFVNKNIEEEYMNVKIRAKWENNYRSTPSHPYV